MEIITGIVGFAVGLMVGVFLWRDGAVRWQRMMEARRNWTPGKKVGPVGPPPGSGKWEAVPYDPTQSPQE